MKRRIITILLVFVFLLGACIPSPASVDEIVQATLQALTAQAPAAATGSISGSLNYPSSFIPPLRVVAYLTGSSQYFFVDTVQDQNTYQIDNLPVGTYHVVAYSMGGSGFPAGLAGGYSQYVLCGMQQACLDHALVDAPVNAGQVTGNIDPQDWYAPDGTFPAYPLP